MPKMRASSVLVEATTFHAARLPLRWSRLPNIRAIC